MLSNEFYSMVNYSRVLFELKYDGEQFNFSTAIKTINGQVLYKKVFFTTGYSNVYNDEDFYECLKNYNNDVEQVQFKTEDHEKN
jgi:hypothetical protein